MKMTFTVSNDKSPQESHCSYSSNTNTNTNTNTNSESAFTSASNSASSSPSSQPQTPSHPASEKTLLKRMGKYLRKALHVGPSRRKQQQQRQTQISPDLSSSSETAADIAIVRSSPTKSKAGANAAEQQQQQQQQQQPSTDVPSLEEGEWEELEGRLDKLLRRLAHNNGRKKSGRSKSDKGGEADHKDLARLLDEELPLDMLPLTGALHVLRRYQVLDANVLIVAWAFFRRLVQSAAKARSLQRLLFVCIVLAAKYHLDSTVNSAIFTRLARVPAVWLARTEYAAWAALDMACFVSPAEYAAAAKELAIAL